MTAPEPRPGSTARIRRDERGAIAVVVGLTALLLFAGAAIAVDLGNLWARKREVQKQVDVAALSAGYLLPMTTSNRTSIADEVAKQLNDNPSTGQPAGITGAQLLNGSGTDGELTFQHDDGTPCVQDCTRMTVLPPEAEVPFFLARAFGESGTTVQRTASVQVFGAVPPGVDMLPFWLPSGCALGSAQADTSQGSTPTPTPTPTPTGTDTASPDPSATASPTPTGGPTEEAGTHQLAGPDPLTTAQGSTVTVSTYDITGLSQQTDRASIRFYSPDGSRFVEYAAQDLKKPESILDVPAFQVSTEVTGTPGDWTAYALIRQQGNGQLTISANRLVFRVTSTSGPSDTSSPDPSATPAASPTSIPVGCVGQDRGNFGQLDSPRTGFGSGQTNTRLALNIADGLDHQLVPFVFAPAQEQVKECGKSDADRIAGAQLDNVSLDGRNCILGDTGNDGPALFDGMIAGVGSSPGRLSTSRSGGHTTCPSRSDVTIDGHTVNNDVLSCFLRNGATLDSIAQSDGVTEAMLDPAVVESPRFVWMPVVYATDRAQKNFQPILDFVPGFITDETQTSSATASNGLELNGNSVKVLTVFCFNKEALPLDARSSTVTFGNGNLRSIVRLVQ